MKKTILIVEDDRLLLTALKTSFCDLGYNVSIAVNGEEGIQRFSESIDLVICDIMMPRVSGISFINELIHTFHITIPVILISTFRSGQQISDSLAYGDIVFLPKPFSFSVISDLVNKKLAL
jgi:DNA-binding response OmpR family regulator